MVRCFSSSQRIALTLQNSLSSNINKCCFLANFRCFLIFRVGYTRLNGTFAKPRQVVWPDIYLHCRSANFIRFEVIFLVLIRTMKSSLTLIFFKLFKYGRKKFPIKLNFQIFFFQIKHRK